MFNVGDKFEVVSGGDCYGLKKGDILTFHEKISSHGAWFKTELGKLMVGGYEGKTALTTTVRPLRTEAEKRGAKFGVMGVNKSTVTGPATIMVAAGETITFEGNATVKQDWVPKFGDRVVFVDPPKDMVGEFGVVLGDNCIFHFPYYVAYNDGDGYSSKWVATTEIKPYEDA